jgi:hypothetical protein
MESKIKKIWFTGSHGTGKTTQLNYFRQFHPEYNVLDVERRDLHAKGIINLNKRAAPWDEIVIAGNVMLGILATPSPFISDRSWICKCAYSAALPFNEELLDAWHIINIQSFPGFTEEEVYFYFPPVIPLEDDGVRSTDPEYQKEIDFLVQFYLDYFQIPFHTIEGYTLQDRHFEIEQVVFGKI